MSQRILIPLDGSELGEAALHYVEDLVSRISSEKKVEVTLFHVITALKHDVEIRGGGAGTITVPYSESELKQMEADAMKYLDKVGENLRSKGATVLSKVVIGLNPADEIIKARRKSMLTWWLCQRMGGLASAVGLLAVLLIKYYEEAKYPY